MKFKITSIISVVTIFVMVFFANCNQPKVLTPAIKPVPLPCIVPGFHFPEDSSVIYGWLNDTKFAPDNYDSVNIYQHAWGIWAGLTDTTNQWYAGDQLLVFETWLGLSDIQTCIINNQSTCDTSFRKTGRTIPTRPGQFEHAARFEALLGVRRVQAAAVPVQNSFDQWVTVSYDPNAACYATSNKIFNISTINKYYKKDGQGNIPDFPKKSITIKPTYLIYHDTGARYLKLPVWLNPPSPNGAENPNQFPYCVYIDRTNKTNNSHLTPALQTDTNSVDIANATCNLSDIIHFTIDKKMAHLMNQQDSAQGMNSSKNGYGTAQPGELALLVAMHVTTKEMADWTWQTFYWTPNPSNPGAPSSLVAAGTRPSQLVGAAAHYAANAAYVMVTPDGAKNDSPVVHSMFGYNPYLEGGFGPGVFAFKNRLDSTFGYGDQSNCMSCHALAVADTVTVPVLSNKYTTDQYVSLQDVYFTNQVKLDFAWSIQTAEIYDAPPYWNPSQAEPKK